MMHSMYKDISICINVERVLQKKGRFDPAQCEVLPMGHNTPEAKSEMTYKCNIFGQKKVLIFRSWVKYQVLSTCSCLSQVCGCIMIKSVQAPWV